jgi:hypothetical protein
MQARLRTGHLRGGVRGDPPHHQLPGGLRAFGAGISGVGHRLHRTTQPNPGPEVRRSRLRPFANHGAAGAPLELEANRGQRFGRYSQTQHRTGAEYRGRRGHTLPGQEPEQSGRETEATSLGSPQ